MDMNRMITSCLFSIACLIGPTVSGILPHFVEKIPFFRTYAHFAFNIRLLASEF